MCGIAGIFEFDRAARADRHLLERMTELIAHRGPDDSHHVLRGNIGLGHRRLSIIDLSSAGRQPMSNEDGTVWITYNGECYNYRELAARLRSRGHAFRSSSDTEVILHLYLEQGERFLEEIDGMFALAIWDERKQSLLVARDRIGIKPLYYFADRHRFLFASEMKALLADDRIPVDLDPVALADYFHLLSIPDPRSILKGIRKLSPGHYLVVNQRGIEQHRYWDLDIRPDRNASFEAVCGEFRERFATSVTSHMIADVPVGAFLSGGVDSSAIVAAASPVSELPIETFSITFPGLAEFDESAYAAAAAAHCGAQHHEFNLTPNLIDGLSQVAWYADEPFAISSAFALFFLAKLAREHVKVVLSGDGGDEVFAGYVWRHVDFPEIPKAAVATASRAAAVIAALGPFAALLPERLRRRLGHVSGSDERYLRSFTCFQKEDLAELLQPDAAGVIVEALRENIVQQYLDQAPGEEQLARKLYTDVKTTLVSEMLTKVDRMTMAHGLEARVPFLDHHLVEWAFTIPGRYKLANNEGKLLVKKAMEGRLPRDLLYRRKQGFNVPLKLWMRTELREFVRDSLTAIRFRARGLYRPKAVDELLDRHFSGRADCSNKIFALLMLELWHQQFVDNRLKYCAAA
jgi:asparagine synthase (glutamine-hydrolysing)